MGEANKCLDVEVDLAGFGINIELGKGSVAAVASIVDQQIDVALRVGKKILDALEVCRVR